MYGRGCSIVSKSTHYAAIATLIDQPKTPALMTPGGVKKK